MEDLYFFTARTTTFACSCLRLPLMTMGRHEWGIRQLLAGRDFVFLDHVVEHLIDGEGAVEDAVAGGSFVELEGDDAVELTGEIGEDLQEGIAIGGG